MIIFHVCQRKERNLHRKQKTLDLSHCWNILCSWKSTKHVVQMTVPDTLLLIRLSVEKQ